MRVSNFHNVVVQSGIRKFILVFLLSFVYFFSIAQKTWDGGAGTNNWGDGNNWSPDGVPLVGQTVTISNNGNLTVNVNGNYSCSSLTMTYTGTTGGTITLNIPATRSLSVTNDVTLNYSDGNGGENITLNVSGGTLSCSNLNLEQDGANTQDAILQVSNVTGIVNVTGNITMAGSNLRNYLYFTANGIINVGGTINGGGITSTAGGGATAPISGTVNYNNASSQTVGTYTYFNLQTSNGGTKSLGGNVTINNQLNLTSGLLTLGANNLTLAALATVSGTAGATNMVVTNGTGQFVKRFAIDNTAAFTFPIGETTGTTEYSPVTLDFLNNSVADRTIGVRVTDDTHPGNGASTDYLSRYWSFTASGAGTYSYTMATYDYFADDVNGLESNMLLNYWDGSAWTEIASSTVGSNQIATTATLDQGTGPLNNRDYTGRKWILAYCTPSSTNTGFPITNVTFASINNSVENPNDDYEDFTGSVPPATILRGQTYPISVTADGLSPNRFYGNVFIDWNQDGDFGDAGEEFQLGNYTSNLITYTGNILVPVTATPGITRMRVMHKFNSYSTPCYVGTNNLQVEDYLVNIVQPGTSTITAGAGTETTTISSLIDTQGEAVLLNFDFSYNDDGSTPGTDSNPTLISGIRIYQGTGNDITVWSDAIAGAILTDGSNTQTSNVTINGNSIEFGSISTSSGSLGYIADNTSKTYTLRIWLKSSMGGNLAQTIDQLNFVFSSSSIGFDFETGSSIIALAQSQNSGASNNEVTVAATELIFTGQPSSTATSGIPLTIQPIVGAADANGNIDRAISSTVSLSNTGSLSMTNNTASFVSGLANFVTFQFTTGGKYVNLNASDGTLASSITSTEIAVDISACTLFTEDFNTYASTSDLPTTPAGWAFLEPIPSVNDWGIANVSGLDQCLTVYRNTNGFQYLNTDNAEQIAYYTTPINAVDFKNLSLDFRWQCTGENGFDYGTIVWSTDGINWQLANGTTYYGQATFIDAVGADLSVCDGQVFYIGFRWINNGSGGNNPPFALDNVVIKGFPKFDYNFGYRDDTYQAITGTIVSLDGQAGANLSLPLGFSFDYDGNPVTAVRVNENGWMEMGTTHIADAAATNSLSSLLNTPFLAPFWDDLTSDAQTRILYGVTGSTPARIFTVEWRDVLWGSERENFQVKLYESSDIIEFWYGGMNTHASGSVSIGINNDGGCMNKLISVSPGTVPIPSYSGENDTINSVMYLNSGTVYMFSPLNLQNYTSWQAADVCIGQADWAAQSTIINQSTTPHPSSAVISSKNVLAVGEQGVDYSPTDIREGRILIWNTVPTSNGTPADVVLGKSNFTDVTGGCTADRVNSINGVCFTPDGEKLIAADYKSNRVLIWNSIPTVNGTPADVVVGQSDFTSSASALTSTGLNGPTDVYVLPTGQLVVADYGNNRVLIYNSVPTTNGAAADVVIGQANFTSKVSGCGPNLLDGPWGIAYSPNGELLITDPNNNRILVFDDIPTTNGPSADRVIGQNNFTSNTSGTSNSKFYVPVTATVSVDGKLAVGEFFNHRVVVFNQVPAHNGGIANTVLGQPNFIQRYQFNDGVSLADQTIPDNRNMKFAYATRYDLNGRLLVVGRDMRRCMLYGETPSEIADLQIDIVSADIDVCVYSNVEYHVSLTNNGPDDAYNVVVNAQLPVGLISATYNASIGTYNQKSGYWTVPFIANGQTVNLYFSGEVQTGVSGTIVTAYANIIASKQADSNYSNNGDNQVVAIRNFYAPTLTLIDDQYINRNSHTIPIIEFTVADDEGLSDISTYTCTSSNIGLIPVNYVTNLLFGGTEPDMNLDIYPEPDLYGYSDIVLRVTDTHGCYNEEEFRVTVGNIWEGNTDTEWNITDNWSSGIVPTDLMEAIIPTTPVGGNFPIIDSDGEVCEDLVIEPGAYVILNDTRTLHIYGNLNIHSSALGTGSFVDLNTSGFDQVIIDGMINIDRYVSNDAWHYLSAPLNGVSNKTLTESVCTPYNMNLIQYNEAYVGADWQAGWEWPFVTPNNDVLTVGRGYGYYTFSGDCSDNVRYTGSTGDLNTGDFSYTVTNQDDTYSPTGFGPHRGWNLIGNPYPSGLNADEFMTSNATVIDGTLYFWDEVGGTGFNSEGSDYAAYNTTLGGTTGTGSGAVVPDQYISSGQAFYVHRSATDILGTSVNFDNTMREAENSYYFKKTQNKSAVTRIKLSMMNPTSMYNELVIGMIEEATNGKDPRYDGYKMEGNPQFSFYSKIENENFVFQGIPVIGEKESRSVHLGFNAGMIGDYIISPMIIEHLPENVIVYLEDTYEHKVVDIQKITHYSFSVEEIGRYDDRFVLHFNMNHSPKVMNPIEDKTIVAGDYIEFDIPANTFGDEDEGDVLSYKATLTDGSPLPDWIDFMSGMLKFRAMPDLIHVGEYTIRVTANDSRGAGVYDDFKLSVIRFVGVENVLPGISIYPNPSTGRFSIKCEGNELYTYRVRDITGKLIIENKATGTVEVDLSDSASGIYLIQVNYEGQTLNYKLMLK